MCVGFGVEKDWWVHFDCCNVVFLGKVLEFLLALKKINETEIKLRRKL